ncbi:MAG: PQQ-binding-like beta-propeller repeat protein [Bryobacteraceae bacterium]
MTLLTVAAGAGFAVMASRSMRLRREVKKVVTRWNERTLERHREEQQKIPVPVLPKVESVERPPDWPRFLGPTGDGIVRARLKSLPWPASGPRVLWKQPIGGGQGSFLIAAGRACTIEQRGEDEVVACYALNSGRELWTYRYRAHFTTGMGPPGPRSTPTIAGGRLYAQGATGVLTCLDATTGKLIWRRNILEDTEAKNLYWGMAATPLVASGRLYAAPGGEQGGLIAYDPATGAPLWTSGKRTAGYSSPILAQLAGVPHLLVFDGEGLTAYNPDDGAERWHHPWKTEFGVNAAQPIVVDQEHVLISSGYGRGASLLRVDRHEAGIQVQPVWENINLKLKYTSGVLKDDHVYGADDTIFACLNVRTGERAWKGGRYGSAHVLLAGGYLLIQCENGDLALLEASPREYRELSRIPALDGATANSPAAGEGKLIVRNGKEMICFALD